MSGKQDAPKWTIRAVTEPTEGSRWRGVAYEFFDDEEAADNAYRRHVMAGACVSKSKFRSRERCLARPA